MELTMNEAAMNMTGSNRKIIAISYWFVTAIFCLQMGFTAYAQLHIPQVAQEFARLGFPDYFRIELTWAKFVGILLLLAPAPVWLKEWAYAGFSITLVSALIAHFSMGEGVQSWMWAAGTGVLLALSYLLWWRMGRRYPA
jgi:hypothetical protein